MSPAFVQINMVCTPAHVLCMFRGVYTLCTFRVEVVSSLRMDRHGNISGRVMNRIDTNL